MIAPSKAPQLWDKLIVPGRTSPGVVKLSGPGLVFGWDIVNASASSGGVTTRINEPLKEFEAEFEIVDEVDLLGRSEFDDWDEFEKVLRDSVAKTKRISTLGGLGSAWAAQPLDVYHPDLARVGITAMVVKSIGLVALDGKGGGKVKVAFIEYKPPKQIRYAQTKTEGDRQIEQRTAKIEALQNEWKNL